MNPLSIVNPVSFASETESRNVPFQTETFSIALNEWLDKLAAINIDFVIEGETGTGKDTFARQLYERSGCSGAFIAINCAAIPETLAESELFGVVAGAYTGAVKTRTGHIESANDGILFLDEIDSMPLSLQAKFLRVLETRSVMRLGSTETQPLNLRVIGASQRPLIELVEEKVFRSDLYFRLSTVRITLPTLRDQIETIIPQFKRFAAEAAINLKRPLPAMTQALIESMLMHHWPGNMRELKAASVRFVLGLSPLDEGKSASGLTLKDRMNSIEQCLIVDSLSRHENQVTEAATELGIPARTLYNKIKSLNLQETGILKNSGTESR